MLRNIHSAAFLAMIVCMTVLDAGAAYPPVTGSIACTVHAGTLTIRPGLETTPSTKANNVRIRIDAADTTCENGSVEGGKLPITAVSVKVSATAAVGSFCTSPPRAPLLTGKVRLQFKGLAPNGKLQTVAVNKTTIAEEFRSSSTLRFALLTPNQAEDAFVGEAVSILVSPEVLDGLCTDAAPLEGFTLSGSVTTTDSGCDGSWIGDGRCDAGCNDQSYAYDGGDCCAGSCMPGGTYPCGISGYNCIGGL